MGTFLFHQILLLTERAPAFWRNLRFAGKLAAAACIAVLLGMLQLGMFVTGHVIDGVVQKAATATALYMDSFVERHVQELAGSHTLSPANQEALEKLLSPVSMHRPIIGFRIWAGDEIVFSNEREVIGKRIPPIPERQGAWRGHVEVSFDLDGEDDVQVRALNVPILEVYAPVREIGTGRIIAVAETHELAIELKHEVFVTQAMWWAGIGGVTLALVLLLLSIASTGGAERNSLVTRIAELSRLGEESEHRRRKVSLANLSVSGMNERSLRQMGAELHHGPAQLVALALLKFDTLETAVDTTRQTDPWQAEDLETIRKALSDTLQHINSLSTSQLPSGIEHMSVAETLARAVACHERITGMSVSHYTQALPEQLPFAFKAAMYRYTLEALERTRDDFGVQALHASCHGDIFELEVIGSRKLSSRSQLTPETYPPALAELRDRVEAVGGSFSCGTTTSGALSLTAHFNPSEILSGG